MKISSKVLAVLSIFTVLAGGLPQAEAALLVGNSRGNAILLFDEGTGGFLGNFTTPGSGGMRSPDDLTFGPDGNLYVSVGGASGLSLLDPTYPTDSAVLRFGPTGDFLGIAATGNGLTRPYGNAFGPDGSLYVSSFRTNQILRFNGQTGEFLGVFASDNNGGLGSPNGLNGPNGLLFGPDGSLYVTTEGTANDLNGALTFSYASQVLRYSPEQVAGSVPTTTPTVFVDQPVALPETFGFVSLLGLALAPDNNSIYVSDFAGGIRQYDLTGQLLQNLSTNYTGTTPSNNFIGSLTFGTGDNSNTLYSVGFDFTQSNLGTILSYANGQGSETSFSGTSFTSSNLSRPIGVTAAVPEPSTMAGLGLGLAGLAAARRKRSQKAGVEAID
jgi:sugar lactone lactonase YvrE